jgi:hypothetical protein
MVFFGFMLVCSFLVDLGERRVFAPVWPTSRIDRQPCCSSESYRLLGLAEQISAAFTDHAGIVSAIQRT